MDARDFLLDLIMNAPSGGIMPRYQKSWDDCRAFLRATCPDHIVDGGGTCPNCHGDTQDDELNPVAVIDEESAGFTVLARFATIADAEAHIAAMTDKAKVARGGYGIDAPEAMLNPRALPTSEQLTQSLASYVSDDDVTLDRPTFLQYVADRIGDELQLMEADDTDAYAGQNNWKREGIE
jgi:hypothetical protein